MPQRPHPHHGRRLIQRDANFPMRMVQVCMCMATRVHLRGRGVRRLTAPFHVRPRAVLMAMVETAIAGMPGVYPRSTAASIRCRRFHWGRGQQESLGGANGAGVVESKSGATSRPTRCRDDGFRMSSALSCSSALMHTASVGCVITVSLCEPKQQPSHITLTACSRPRYCCGDTAKGRTIV